MAAGLAERDATYGLGTSANKVKAAVIALIRDYDANPRTFTDLPKPVDGSVAAQAAIQPAANWTLAAQLFVELRDATGPTAPPC